MKKFTISCIACIAFFAIALGGCKKDSSDEPAIVESPINVEAITEENALEEADKIIKEIDNL